MFFCLPDAGHTTRWNVEGKTKNRVTFISEVLVLTFQGITDQRDGYVYWEGSNLFERKTQVRFKVALKTLVTDNGKRDRDMREVLEIRTWPYAMFEGVPTSIVRVDSNITAFLPRSYHEICKIGGDASKTSCAVPSA